MHVGIDFSIGVADCSAVPAMVAVLLGRDVYYDKCDKTSDTRAQLTKVSLKNLLARYALNTSSRDDEHGEFISPSNFNSIHLTKLYIPLQCFKLSGK